MYFVVLTRSSVSPMFRAFIKVRIIDSEEYEKHQSFRIELGEPKLVKPAPGLCLFIEKAIRRTDQSFSHPQKNMPFDDQAPVGTQPSDFHV